MAPYDAALMDADGRVDSTAGAGGWGGDEEDDHNMRTVLTVVLLVAALLALSVGAFSFMKRRRAAAFHPLQSGRNDNDAAHASFEADAAAWNASALTPTATYPPSSPFPSSPYTSHPSFDPSLSSSQVHLVPPQSPFLPPEPPSPSYSPSVPAGHSSEPLPSAPPPLAGRSDGRGGGDDSGEETPTEGGPGRNSRGLTLEAESLAGGSVVSGGTAPPPYSPKVVGVGADLGRR